MDKFTVASDRQKGLLSAVDHVFPGAGHQFCLHHIMDNTTKTRVSLTGKERSLICSLARSDYGNDFKLYRAELYRTKATAVEYLDNIGAHHWVNYRYQEQFELPTYSEITSNLSEQANNWMNNEMRSSKPSDAFYQYFLKLSQLLFDKRQSASNWLVKSSEPSLVPLLAVKLHDLTKASAMCKFTPVWTALTTFNTSVIRHWEDSSIRGALSIYQPEKVHAENGKTKSFHVCMQCAAAADGTALETLYDAARLSVAHFRDTYTQPFKP